MPAPLGYSVAAYGDMIANAPRMDAYYRALAAAVTPGCTVLDIGAGTGIFSLLACRLGAGRVHAVEPDAAIAVAEKIARDNGMAERISFYRGLSSELSLQRPADVMVSDLRGVLPLLQNHIPTVADARSRLLATGGTMIPRRDELWAALVCAPGAYRACEEPWADRPYGLDLARGLDFVLNSWRRQHFTPDELVSEPQRWALLDYARITDPAVEGAPEWTLDRATTAHGVAVWFDTQLVEGIGFSNAPGRPKLIYGQAFFPWRRPLALERGDRVSVRLRARPVDGEYVWQWNTEVCPPGAPQSPRERFSQSTFQGVPLLPEDLRKLDASHVPRLDQRGQADLFLLAAMDGSHSLESIARRAAERFPGEFSDWRAALGRAGQLAKKFS